MSRKLTEEEKLDRDIEKAAAAVLKAFDKYQPAKEAYDAAAENLDMVGYAYNLMRAKKGCQKLAAAGLMATTRTM